MPPSNLWKTDGSKTSTSKPFQVTLGEQTKNYTLKTEVNIINKGQVGASKITLQDEVKQGNTSITRALATSTDGGKTWVLEKDSEGKSLLDSTQISALYPGNKLYSAVKNVAQLDAKLNGASDIQTNQLTNGNAASTPAAGIGTSSYGEEVEYLNKEIKSIKARTEYDSAIYPIGLNSKFQDCIKFSIVTYQQSGLKGFGESLAGSRIVNVNSKGIPGFEEKEDRKILATIVLPIPGGIQDSNTVNWSGGNLNPVAEGIGSVMQAALQGKDAAAEAKRQAELVNVNEARSAIISKMTEGVLGNNGVMQRQFGTIVNPNLELLFNSPELRTFAFSFKLSPRSKNEAVEVKKIIRNFKQAMSVKRSTSSFLLQSPHTFAISYIFQDRSHPYLNKFKECALISCNVNYTPEGNYMSFDDSDAPSMISYQLDLTFQELEPLYDDNYGDEYDNIGF